MRIVGSIVLLVLVASSCGSDDVADSPAVEVAPTDVIAASTEESEMVAETDTTEDPGLGDQGSEETDSSTTSTSVAPITDSSNYVMADELVCPDGRNGMAYDHLEGAVGAASMEAAAGSWGYPGGGSSGREQFQPVADEDTGQVDLLDGSGTVRAILQLRNDGNGWLIETSVSCVEPLS